jgi:hypothetical protein
MFWLFWELVFCKNTTILRLAQEAHSNREVGLWIFSSLKKIWKKREGSELSLKRISRPTFPRGMSRPLFRGPSFP